MRENMGLYRGKNVSTGEWVYGYLYIRHDGECEIGSYNKEYNIERWTTVVDPSTIGEYTGLIDKNGKRIFEGDVVATAAGKPHEVMFADGEFFMDGTSIPFKWVCKFEVIGNVHDNPEMKGD